MQRGIRSICGGATQKNVIGACAVVVSAGILFHHNEKSKYINYADTRQQEPQHEGDVVLPQHVIQGNKRSDVDDMLELERSIEREEKEKYKAKVEKLNKQYHEKLLAKKNKYQQKLSQHHMEIMEQKRLLVKEISEEIAEYGRALDTELAERLANASARHDESFYNLIQAIRRKKSAILQKEIERITEKVQESDIQKKNQLLAWNQRYRNLQSQIDTLDKSLEMESIHRLCVGLIALNPKLEKGSPFHEELAELRRVAVHDPLLTTVLNQIPDGVAHQGVLNHEQLYEMFRELKAIVRSQAFVPVDANYVWQFIALLVSKTTFPVRGYVSGTDPDSILARAEYFLSVGKLESAIKELENFTGLSGDVLRNWLTLAKQRVAIDCSFSLVRTHLINLNHSQTQ